LALSLSDLASTYTTSDEWRDAAPLHILEEALDREMKEVDFNIIPLLYRYRIIPSTAKLQNYIVKVHLRPSCEVYAAENIGL
jgi:hypothetical protein